MAGCPTCGQTKWMKLFELTKKARVLNHFLDWPQQRQMWKIQEVLTKMVDPRYELSRLGPKLGLVWLLCGNLERIFFFNLN